MKEIYCKDTGERTISYKDYLKTKHWEGIKVKYRGLYINECCMCKGDKFLAIHHMTYERVGNEDFNDLVFLCKDCHTKLHEALGSDTSKLKSYLRSHRVKPKKKLKGKPTKGKRTCSQCIDNYRGTCLVGVKTKTNKNINGNCKSFKQNESKRRTTNDDYFDNSYKPKRKKVKKEE